MKYQLDSDFILIEVNRSTIVDISPGDELEAAGLGATYRWGEQDMQFLENNPDARIFLKFERISNSFQGRGLVVVPQEVY
jgi:hypothetical protein